MEVLNKDNEFMVSQILNKMNVKIECYCGDNYYNSDGDYVFTYHIKIIRKRKKYEFVYESINKSLNIYAINYTIITYLNKENLGSFDDFCYMFGYNNDSIKILNLYQRLSEQYKELSTLFTSKELELLRTIE